ncbi:MAG: GNAT family N-acetyltransferase [Deltaproteobacteria bacterium]|nr:GNAT family N-acetyltransferase [Deltaproteobacteria bacterium]
MTTLRLALLSDLARVRAIELAACELFRMMPDVYERYTRNPTPEAVFSRGLANETLWVADVTSPSGADETAGFLLGAVVDGCFHIDELDVDPVFGQRGIGRTLVEYACSYARAQRYPACTLVTMTSVPWNAPFYAKLGFCELPWDALTPTLRVMREREIAQGHSEDRIVMRRVFDYSAQ